MESEKEKAELVVFFFMTGLVSLFAAAFSYFTGEENIYWILGLAGFVICEALAVYKYFKS